MIPLRVRTRVRHAPTVMTGAGGYRLDRGPVGCVLVHGFTSTAYDTRALGEFLADRDISVAGTLIAGHGTHPDDLADTTLPNWLSSIEEDIAYLRTRCSTIFAVGISLGGTFLLNLAPLARLDGLVLIGTPLVFRHHAFYRAAYYTLRLTGQRTIRKWYSHTLDPAIRAQRPNYNRIPITCGPDVTRALRHSRENLPSIDCPVLLMQSTTDHAIDERTINLFHERLGSVEKEVVWVPNSYHVLTIDHGKEETFAHIHRFIERHTR